MGKLKQFIYAIIEGRDDRGKKITKYSIDGEPIKKRDANVRCRLTGDGLVVVDIDTKELDLVDKKLVKLLGRPTVETGNGYHWYLTGIDELRQTQGLLPKVDVRNKGGHVYDKYWGDDTSIWYKKVGEVQKVSKKLKKFLLKRQEERPGAAEGGESVDGRNYGERWTDPGDGQRHEASLHWIILDYRDGYSREDVEGRYREWLERCGLKVNTHELRLMNMRMRDSERYATPFSLEGEVVEGDPAEHAPYWVKETRGRSDEKRLRKEARKKRGTGRPGSEDERSIADIAITAEMSEWDIKDIMRIASRSGALELERIQRQIKEETGITMATLGKMLAEDVVDEGVNSFFENNRVVWEPQMGVFAEINGTYVIQHSKTNFPQTLSSRTGVPKGEGLNKMLATIPDIYVVYEPMGEAEMLNDHGKPAINVWKGVPIGVGMSAKKVDKAKRREPKLIGKVLDNLFIGEDEARKRFVNWLAFIAQTGQRSCVAWGFFGASGSGKGLIAEVLKNIVGFHNTSFNVGDTDLQSSFNPYAENVQFIHLNEVASDYHGRHGVANKLKALVTDPIIRINKKGIGEYSVKNYANIILNSNKMNPIELDDDDRRWNMIISHQPLKACDWWYDGAYNDAMKEVEAFALYLLAYDMDQALATTPMPHNDAKRRVVGLTTAPARILASAIMASDSDEVAAICHLDPDDVLMSQVKWAARNKMWDSDLLLSLYRLATDKNDATKNQMARLLIKQYCSKGAYSPFKNANELGEQKRALKF